MKTLALDLGKFNTVCCFFDTATRQHRFLTAATEPAYLNTVFKSEKIDLVVMEACGPSGWINDLAQSLDLKTFVCSTNEEAWRWANVKRKTDKDDALKLARMVAMKELKPVHMPSPEHREFRSLVKYRKSLDQRINKLKNAIRAWFVNHGITIDSGDKAWHTGRARINSFRKPLAQCRPQELWKGELDIELTLLDSLTEQLDLVIKKLEAISKNDPRSDQCKARHRREAREAKQAQVAPAQDPSPAKPTSKKTKAKRPVPKSVLTPANVPRTKNSRIEPKQSSVKRSSAPDPKSRRTRKPVARS